MSMKRATIKRCGERVVITAPKDKELAIDMGQLQHGVLSIGEYGPSGQKICMMINWDEVWFDAEDHGYIIEEKAPF